MRTSGPHGPERDSSVRQGSSAPAGRPGRGNSRVRAHGTFSENVPCRTGKRVVRMTNVPCETARNGTFSAGGDVLGRDGAPGAGKRAVRTRNVPCEARPRAVTASALTARGAHRQCAGFAGGRDRWAGGGGRGPRRRSCASRCRGRRAAAGRGADDAARSGSWPRRSTAATTRFDIGRSCFASAGAGRVRPRSGPAPGARRRVPRPCGDGPAQAARGQWLKSATAPRSPPRRGFAGPGPHYARTVQGCTV